jgi:hypothetical protein
MRSVERELRIGESSASSSDRLEIVGLDPDLNVEMLVLALNAKGKFPSRSPHSAFRISLSAFRIRLDQITTNLWRRGDNENRRIHGIAREQAF